MSSESYYPITPVDEQKIAGQPVSTNAGNADAGTQRVVIASDQSAIPVVSTPNFATRQDTFTASGNGTTVNRSSAPLAKFGVQVKGTGAVPTSWEVKLEGSLDGVNFTEVLDHVTGTGDGQVMWTGTLDSPCLYFRSRVVSVVLGSATNIVVTVLGMG